MRSFLVMTLGGAAIGVLFSWLLLARVGNADEAQALLIFGGIGAFFGAKFGLIGWAILMGVRFVSAIVERATPAVIDQISKSESKS